MKKTIVVASNNQHKLKEFKDILVDYNILSLKDIGFTEEIEENGLTFEENALIKAKAVHNYLKSKKLDYIVIADDSGLCVESINGEPGVYSARYAGVHGDDKANRDKLQKKLQGKNREAYFECVIAVYYSNGEHKTFEGKTFGRITEEEIGNKEFGYDCIFYSNELNKTFGEATPQEKNTVSHRGKAILQLQKVDFFSNYC